MTFFRNNKVIVGVVIYSKILIAEVCIYHLTSKFPVFLTTVQYGKYTGCMLLFVVFVFAT